MKTKKIYNVLDKISPFTKQEEWDNSTLNVGNMKDSVKNIYISLDIDKDIIKKVPENSLIITHHPLIFSKIKNILFKRYPSNLIKKLIKKNISLISLHTNFDKTHLNYYVAKNILKLQNISTDNFICKAKIKEQSVAEFATTVQKRLGLKKISFVDRKKTIKQVAITTGSGAGLIGSFKADCFLTGDIKYHDAMKAKSINLGLIDITHYKSEIYFAKILQEELKINGIFANILNSKDPFTIN